MSRVAFNEINNLPDPLDSNAFELLLGNIPNFGNSLDLTLKCQTASLPGFSNEAFEVGLHGYVIKARGRKTFARTLSVTYQEMVDGSTYKAMKAWDEYIAGTRTGNSGGYKKGPGGYSVQSRLIVYDTIGAIALQVDFVNMFLQEISDVTLDGNSSQAMQISATLSFDNIIMNGVPLL